MQKILITGICGMVGSHLADYYFDKDVKVIGTFYKPTIDLSDIIGKAELIECDIRYFLTVYKIINHYKPDIIFHLAAQSYPTVSWGKPQETMETNINGTINVFESIKQIRLSETDYSPITVVACSSAEYGDSLNNIDYPADENTPFLPLHPYGVSKVAQDLLSYQYYKNDKLKVVRARIFNTTGPRKTNDVCSDFTKRVVLMEKQKQLAGKLLVGNLSSKRAIMDVRDLVKALVLLSEKGKYGEAYNICGENVYEIYEIVDLIRKNTEILFEVEVDSNLLRITDEKIISGNANKLINQTGWIQKYKLNETISDMMEYWRSKL